MRITKAENRRSPRKRRSDPLLWNTLGSDTTRRTGWLLEASDDSLAFAWRGTKPPAVGTILEITPEYTPDPPFPARAVVRRVAHCHADLCVIAAQHLSMREFPPAAHARASPPVVESKDGPPVSPADRLFAHEPLPPARSASAPARHTPRPKP